MHLMLAQFPSCIVLARSVLNYFFFLLYYLQFFVLQPSPPIVVVVLSGCCWFWALVVAIAAPPPFCQRHLLTFNDAALYFNTLCLPGMLMPKAQSPQPAAHVPPLFFCPNPTHAMLPHLPTFAALQPARAISSALKTFK